MKAIFKRTEVEHNNIISVRIELFGLAVYESQRRDERSPGERRRPIGFIQFPINAPTDVEEAEDYFPDEEI